MRGGTVYGSGSAGVDTSTTVMTVSFQKVPAGQYRANDVGCASFEILNDLFIVIRGSSRWSFDGPWSWSMVSIESFTPCWW